MAKITPQELKKFHSDSRNVAAMLLIWCLWSFPMLGIGYDSVFTHPPVATPLNAMLLAMATLLTLGSMGFAARGVVCGYARQVGHSRSSPIAAVLMLAATLTLGVIDCQTPKPGIGLIVTMSAIALVLSSTVHEATRRCQRMETLLRNAGLSPTITPEELASRQADAALLDQQSTWVRRPT